jgi:hypothetical protein
MNIRPYHLLKEPRIYDVSSIVMAAILAGAGVTTMLLSIPIYGIYAYNRRKVDELKARQSVQIAEETRLALEGLRKEIAALRDTTTEYDVSFDTALHRIESRVAHMEQRVGQVERVVEQVHGQHV